MARDAVERARGSCRSRAGAQGDWSHPRPVGRSWTQRLETRPERVQPGGRRGFRMMGENGMNPMNDFLEQVEPNVLVLVERLRVGFQRQ